MTDGKRRDVTATRAVLRELKAEDRVAHEGREFLDQKRMLLAAEILRRLRELDAVRADLQARQRSADAALAKAIARHGLEGVLAYPAEPIEIELGIERTRFVGVELVDVEPEVRPAEVGVSAVQPSPEARLCRRAFLDLLAPTARIAALSSTLVRLGEEYRQTDRRVRALERVLMPEIDATLRSVSEELDEQDQDEAIYARLPHRRKT